MFSDYVLRLIQFITNELAKTYRIDQHGKSTFFCKKFKNQAINKFFVTFLNQISNFLVIFFRF